MLLNVIKLSPFLCCHRLGQRSTVSARYWVDLDRPIRLVQSPRFIVPAATVICNTVSLFFSISLYQETTPVAMAAPELQVWNNAAFDGGEPSGKKASPARHPFSPATAAKVRPPDSGLRPASGEENQAPRPPAAAAKPSPSSKNLATSIDAEIEKVEREIGRLSSRLEALRIKKMTGRDKFLKPKQISSSEEKRKEEVPAASGKKIHGSPASRSAAAPLPAGGRRSFTTKLRGITEEKRKQEEIAGSTRRPIAMRSNRRIESPSRTATTSVEFRRRGIRHAGRGSSTAVGSENLRRRTLFPESEKKRRGTPGEEQRKGSPPAESTVRTPPSIRRFAERLPRIRTTRGRGAADESPRSSGRAKRASELTGRESFFGKVTDDNARWGASP